MRADRLISILILLQTQGKLTARQLADELEVSERTIYRDMDALSTAGVPVYCERGPGGGCALLDSYRTNLTGLTREEVRALFMLSIPAPLEELGVDQDLRGAMLKLSAALPEILRPEGSQVQALIHLDSSSAPQSGQPSPHLATLQRALWTGRCLDLTYRLAFGAQVSYRYAPYGLVAKSNLWHLVCSRDEAIFVLPVSDILGAEITEQAFTLPDTFNLAEYWADWSARIEGNQPEFQVRLRMSPQLYERLVYFKNPILPPDRGELSQDDTGWYNLVIQFDTFENARKQLLNFGGAVEVLSPRPLRDSLRDFARQTLAIYQPETGQ